MLNQWSLHKVEIYTKLSIYWPYFYIAQAVELEKSRNIGHIKYIFAIFLHCSTSGTGYGSLHKVEIWAISSIYWPYFYIAQAVELAQSRNMGYVCYILAIFLHCSGSLLAQSRNMGYINYILAIFLHCSSNIACTKEKYGLYLEYIGQIFTLLR